MHPTPRSHRPLIMGRHGAPTRPSRPCRTHAANIARDPAADVPLNAPEQAGAYRSREEPRRAEPMARSDHACIFDFLVRSGEENGFAVGLGKARD